VNLIKFLRKSYKVRVKLKEKLEINLEINMFRFESDYTFVFALSALKRVAVAEGSPQKTQLYCDHCPMIWYHHICVDVDGKLRGRNEEREMSLISISLD